MFGAREWVYAALGEVQLCHKMVVLSNWLQLNQKMMMLAKRDAKKIEQHSHQKNPFGGVSDNSILDFFLDKCIKSNE